MDGRDDLVPALAQRFVQAASLFREATLSRWLTSERLVSSVAAKEKLHSLLDISVTHLFARLQSKAVSIYRINQHSSSRPVLSGQCRQLHGLYGVSGVYMNMISDYLEV